MNQPVFDALYDTPARADLAAIGPEQLETDAPATLRTYAVRLWLDVYQLQMSVDILRGGYGNLVAIARDTVANGGPHLDRLRQELEYVIDDPDLPVSYLLTDEARAFLTPPTRRRP